MRPLAGLWVVLCAGCVARDPGPVAAPMGAPFAAWLETEGFAQGVDAVEVTLVVMPLRPLGSRIEIVVPGRAPRSIDTRGGRLAYRFTRAEPVRIEASWRDPGGAAGAHALLVYPTQPVAAVEFVSIMPQRLGRDGPTVDRAIRIGRRPGGAALRRASPLGEESAHE